MIMIERMACDNTVRRCADMMRMRKIYGDKDSETSNYRV